MILEVCQKYNATKVFDQLTICSTEKQNNFQQILKITTLLKRQIFSPTTINQLLYT